MKRYYQDPLNIENPLVQSIEALAEKEGRNFQDIISQVAVRYFYCRNEKLANI